MKPMSKEALVSSNSYTLVECVDAYSESCVPIWSNENTLAETAVHKAIPYGWYALIRWLYFQFEITVIVIVGTVVSSVCLAIAGLGEVQVSFLPFAGGIVGLLIGAFWLKYENSINSQFTGIFNLRVVGSDGFPLTKKQAVLRAAVFGVTWFLFPLHLVFFAANSRRFIHDFASGAYVLVGAEDLNKSFYPRSKPWLALVLVGLFVFMEGRSIVDMPPAFQRAVAGCLAQHFGTESRLDFEWMEWQYSKLSIDYANVSKDEARQYISIYSKLLALRTKYYGQNDSQAGLYRLYIRMLENKAKQYE